LRLRLPHDRVTKFVKETPASAAQVVAERLSSFKIFLSYKNFFGLTDESVLKPKGTGEGDWRGNWRNVTAHAKTPSWWRNCSRSCLK